MNYTFLKLLSENSYVKNAAWSTSDSVKLSSLSDMPVDCAIPLPDGILTLSRHKSPPSFFSNKTTPVQDARILEVSCVMIIHIRADTPAINAFPCVRSDIYADTVFIPGAIDCFKRLTAHDKKRAGRVTRSLDWIMELLYYSAFSTSPPSQVE